MEETVWRREPLGIGLEGRVIGVGGIDDSMDIEYTAPNGARRSRRKTKRPKIMLMYTTGLEQRRECMYNKI